MSKLLIVESPAKAKTISKYLDGAYTVRASVGHIRDLPKSNKNAIDVAGGFIPHYEISKGKEKIVHDLTVLAKKADEILLATDPDREGEAIAWHIAEALKLKKPKRVVFHEITKEAVQKAMKHPREIDDKLRAAQEARRVLDRLFGYDLSGLIWTKLRYGLSAGRVQSPALRILVEREREIKAFIPEKFWVITALLGHLGAELPSGSSAPKLVEFTCVEEPKTQEDAEKIVELGKKADWQVGKVEESEQKRKARAPFTTSTLQQAASSRLGYSPSITMRLAQKLYEAGHITYMRTDSTNLSQQALGEMAGVIKNKFGNNYHESHVFTTKAKNAQEAHEAIRPTQASNLRAGNSAQEQKLYELIWRRALASQMADAVMARTSVTAVANSKDVPEFKVTGSRVIFDGWLKADPAAKGEDVILPQFKEGEKLDLKDLTALGKETEPPHRYTEAGLVKELEKRGIGRPSTYAAIIKTIMDRGYVEKEQRNLRPTETGEVVSTFLETHFADYISDSFTAEMENELDEIASGEREYVKTLKDFYGPFTKAINAKKKLEKITNLGDAPKDIKCPVCGGPMIIKLGRGGKFYSCAKFPTCTGALTMEGKKLEGPKETGEKCPDCEEGKLVEREGRFGTFISCSRYPKCKYIKKDENNTAGDTGVQCPICKKGTMREKRGRFGIFYGCSNYPSCKNIIKSKPTGNICPECSSLMMEGTKTIPERCSNKACPNHNPHKLEKK
ncbi:MAG: type I DNA topoisomerase [bacterium]|nr:type I DNA topoisomerase [bacterium]